MSGISSFFSSFLPTVHADSPEEKPEDKQATETAKVEEGEGAEPKEEVEEEEPEDEHPKIREECQTSPACAPLKHHFDKCQEKVQAGEGFKGEECIEEMFHMMHCSEACAAPKVFAKLR
ncbi:Non-heme 11 kDa protein of cytochrome bc1 complex [Mycena polygramma]|nr:Non-heme 11 kDa protein of cytochrome bc1 complex [Mycena polygramma]